MTQPTDLPLGLVQDHLNLVFSASDGPATERFYGDIIGLRRIPNVPLPGGRYMLRYHGGATELKFIVTEQDGARAASGLTAARGIRSLTFVLPESRRQSIFSRLAVYGLPAPSALPGNSDSTRYALQDFEGNHIELAFITDEPTDPDIVRMEFGFGVSDLAASGQFLQQMLGMSLIQNHAEPHQYILGQSTINLWYVPTSQPAIVGMPHEMMGMSLLQLVIHDVWEARALIVARGGPIHTEPYNVGDLAVVMFIEGPDGILIEFGAAL